MTTGEKIVTKHRLFSNTYLMALQYTYTLQRSLAVQETVLWTTKLSKQESKQVKKPF